MRPGEPIANLASLCFGYERFLLKERDLSQQTVTWHRNFVKRFLSQKFGSGPPNLSKLRPLDVTAFVQRHAHRHGPAQARNLVAAVRSFLSYLNYKGLVDRDLSLVVPKVARWSFSTGPKRQAPSQVRQVLHHCDRSTSVGRRDYAILLLLARLGLRAGEAGTLLASGDASGRLQVDERTDVLLIVRNVHESCVDEIYNTANGKSAVS